MDSDAATLAELAWYLMVGGSVLLLIGAIGLVVTLSRDLLNERAVKKAIRRQK